jgi:hypothetical protein
LVLARQGVQSRILVGLRSRLLEVLYTAHGER